MPIIELKYGSRAIPLAFDPQQFVVLAPADNDRRPLSDVEIGERLDAPIESETLEDRVVTGETVLIVVPDATRETGSGQIVNLVVRRLIANGTEPGNIQIIFATGLHRPVTQEEKERLLTPFIAQRIKTIDHNARDLMQNVRVAEHADGHPIELNRALLEHDHVVLVGGISFHYFAGFTGGRKLICPGCASARTISATHRLAFDLEKLDRREGVGSGLLDGNPVHEAFVDVAGRVKNVFCISTIVDTEGEITDVYCGDLVSSHKAACDAFAAANTVAIKEKRDLVIVSCGGSPFDVNMIQAHKALETAAKACNDGGTIVFLAECGEGTGRSDFLKWFDVENSEALALDLRERYQVNGQTAWSLLRKAERFDVRVISSMPAVELEKMRLTPMQSLSRMMSKIKPGRDGYIIPSGSKIDIKVA